MINTKIKELRSKIIEFTCHVEKMIKNSMEGLKNRDLNELKNVIEKLEPMANDFEVHIDELCASIIAQYQPMAKSLRTVLMVLKMNNDLERLADLAENISKSGISLIEKPLFKPLIDLPKMAEIAIEMLNEAVNAFVNDDVEQARKVCLKDDSVDDLRNQIVRELLTYMMETPAVIEPALKLMDIAKNLERIADLATNISEDVVFIVEGKIIKHTWE